jgi:hypothetical protein
VLCGPEKWRDKMNHTEIKRKIAAVLAEKFLKDLENSAEIDQQFLNTARPVITKLFTELPEDRQALLMYLLKQSALEQLKTSRLNPEVFADGILPTKGPINLKGLEKIKKQVHYIHGVVASTLLSSYGGLGEQRVSVEG